MAGLERLLPLIYHETQQPGSMLCAQHALNSLLQGNYFTAPDLSEIAERIDQLERSYNEDIRGHASANMDDTGFFSVQVLENALHVWGLALVRWRSEAMKPYHDHPHTQLAFVLNQHQHWYTLRRFGGSEENGHWFNLDSSKPSPQWVSKTYLGMFLQQAEHDGYSTFAVVPIDPLSPHSLPRTDADDVASTLPPSAASGSSSGSHVRSSELGFEDEDMDLQAALQASLADPEREGNAGSSSVFNRVDDYPSPVIPTSRTLPGFPPELGSSAREDMIERRPNILPSQDRYGNADIDPVSASMERNRIIMERMRREQEAALREQYEDEIAQFDQVQHDSRRRRGAEVENEDELFQRAMEESLAEHRARTGDDMEMAELDDDNDDDDNDDDDDDGYEAPVARSNVHTMNRVYDDDDAELQAALKASLETMPPGFTLPPSPQPPLPQRLANEPLDTSPSTEPNTDRTVEASEAGTETETETETETDAEGVSGNTARPAREEVSIEEMRRRRLARFGG